MDRDEAHIVYASDDRFAGVLGVSLVSLYENSRDMAALTVYILDCGIGEENREKIGRVPELYGRMPVRWIPARDIAKELDMDVRTDRGSLGQYARLFVSSSLPEGLDRVLYLDCDTLLLKSVRELWNLDLRGKTIGALNDAFSPAYRANIGLEKTDIMFNSGVMVIDLKRWKEQKVEERLLDFIREKKGRIQQGDQGALNAVLSRDTFCFEPRMNAVSLFFDFTYDEMMAYRKPPEGYYREEEVRKAAEDPVLVHFTTSFLSKRPWIEGSRHRYTEEWLKYKAMSPWKEEPLRRDTTGKAKRIAVSVLKKLPRGMMLRLASLAQAYGRPWMNRLRA